MSQVLSLLTKHPLLFDGAMGTQIQAQGLTIEDYAGHPECNAILNISRPDVIEAIHNAYLKAGADIITTNTFGTSRVALSDHDLSDKDQEINQAAVKIAKEAAQSFSTKDKPRFVAGELGPTSKLPTLGHISFEEMFLCYKRQAKELLDNGVDLLLIATCQDILQAKAAASACREVMAEENQRAPLFISVTIESNGKMLLGTDVLAALAILEPFEPDAFGINCASGPLMMEEHLRVLAEHSPFHILCRPNAGLPENVDGKTIYNLSPKDFAGQLKRFVKEIGIDFVGGCCGTTPEHIKALVKSRKSGVRRQKTADRRRSFARVSSLFSSVSLDQEPKPFLIAEQTNANGSKKFRELLLKSDYDSMAAMGKEAAVGAHALDVCVAYAGRDEETDLVEVISRLVKTVDAPIMVDSTNPKSLEAALSIIPGRCIINSINLEDEGKKAEKILGLARKYGAAVICLTMDKEGLAYTALKKVTVAKKLHELALSYNLRTKDLLFDALTLTVASGDKNTADAAVQTLEGVRKIKEEIKGSRTSLGVSNVSYGLKLAGRKAVTSIFLNEALKAGLDAAIVNPSRILRFTKIPKEEMQLALRLLNNNTSKGLPLPELINYYEKKTDTKTNLQDIEASLKKLPAKERLRQKVIDGDKSDLISLLDEAQKETGATEIINKVLLPAMQELGELFGKGKLPLPFVLQSAEVMREAIDILGPKLKSKEKTHKGTMVLATVRGDVHDIGKNLVDIILSSNGFRVINLGIRQPAQEIIKAVKRHNADAVGLSGLLVSSTEVMKEDLETMKHQGVSVPVLVGGAALTKKFTESALQNNYTGKVIYCDDAFAGLKAMEKVIKG